VHVFLEGRRDICTHTYNMVHKDVRYDKPDEFVSDTYNRILNDVTSAIDYLHRHGIVHRCV
jgi:serine/threonine protein kinase